MSGLLVNYKTLTDLWHKTARRHLFFTRDEVDFIASNDTMKFDNVLTAESMDFDFDSARDLWLTKARFTVLQRDYMDLYALESFLDRCERIGLGEAKRGVITQMPCKQHAMRHKKYQWGNCMMGYTFRGGSKVEPTPTLTLHSRVTYISYIGGLDLALAHVLAREIGQRIGLEPEEFRFRWVLDSLQFHGFKSIPYLFAFGLDDVLDEGGKLERKYPGTDYPTIHKVRRWWRLMKRREEEGFDWADEKYGPVKRIMKRYRQYINEDFMEPVPLESLSLEPLRRRG